MKLKRVIFSFSLMFAIFLTVLGIVSADITFSKPIDQDSYIYNMMITNVSSENIDVYHQENSNISYLLLIDSAIKDYSVTFDVINDSTFNVRLVNSLIDELPDDLKDIISYSINISDRLQVNQRDKVVIRYKIKDNLTNSEIETINKYNKIGINVLLNYNQE